MTPPSRTDPDRTDGAGGPDAAPRPSAGMLRDAAGAVRFMTRVPLPATDRPPDLARAAGWFPLVGVGVAAAAVAVRAAAGPLLGPGAATVLAVAAAVAVTGALHEDGLADTADGLWGAHTPEGRRRILHDSRIGTYGAAALGLALLLRVALLAPLDLVAFVQAVVAGHVLGRATALPLTAVLPVAADGGQAGGLAGPAPRSAGVVAGVTVVVVAGALMGGWGIVPVAAAAAAAGGLGVVASRRLDGLTGDALGAANQLAHVTALAAVVALHRTGVLEGWPPWAG